MLQDTITKTIEFYHIDNQSFHKIDFVKEVSFEIPNRIQNEFYFELYRQIIKCGREIISDLMSEHKELFNVRYQLVAVDGDENVYFFKPTKHNVVRYGCYVSFTKLTGSSFVKIDSQLPENAIAGRAWFKPAEKIVDELQSSIKASNSVVAIPTKPNIHPVAVNGVKFKIAESKKKLLEGLDDVRSFVESSRCHDVGMLNYYIQTLNNIEFFIEQCDWKND